MSLEDARNALRERQGAGARYDAPGAPATNLLLARRLTAEFARILNDTPDAALFEQTDRAEVTRAMTVAKISLDARRMSKFIASVKARNCDTPCLIAATKAEIATAATLPPHALRTLFDHTRVHLNVEWREMDDLDWSRRVMDESGQPFVMTKLPSNRADILKDGISRFVSWP